MRRLVLTATLVAATGMATSHAVVVPGYAIVGARIVAVSRPPIEKGTVVIRGGEIVAVDGGTDSPGDVQRIEGAGLTVYPGLIDLHASAGLDQPAATAPQNPESREVTERFRRLQLLRAQVQAADLLRPDAADLGKLASAGFTNAVIVPDGEAIAGQSALIDVVPPEIDPQVGRLAVDLRGPMVLRPAVALHVAFPGRGFLGAYPASLMGGIAFVRQAFADAQHYQKASALAESSREPYDAALAAMGAGVQRHAARGLSRVDPTRDQARPRLRQGVFGRSHHRRRAGGRGSRAGVEGRRRAGRRQRELPDKTQGAGAGRRRVVRGVAGPRRGAARRRGAVCCRSAVWLRVCRFEGP